MKVAWRARLAVKRLSTTALEEARRVGSDRAVALAEAHHDEATARLALCEAELLLNEAPSEGHAQGLRDASAAVETAEARVDALLGKVPDPSNERDERPRRDSNSRSRA